MGLLYILLCRLWKPILFLIAVWKVCVGWQPSPDLAFWERKGVMKKAPCSFLRLLFFDSEIDLSKYDDFLISEVWVALQERKEKLSSCNLLLSGQLNRFQGPSSCLYILWIIGDEKKNVFVVSAPASPTFHRKSRRDPWIIVGIRFNSSLSTQASDCT